MRDGQLLEKQEIDKMWVPSLPPKTCQNRALTAFTVATSQQSSYRVGTTSSVRYVAPLIFTTTCAFIPLRPSFSRSSVVPLEILLPCADLYTSCFVFVFQATTAWSLKKVSEILPLATPLASLLLPWSAASCSLIP
jgi:hypothetical protein